MKKIVVICVVIASIVILGVSMAEQGNFPTSTPTPTATASPTASSSPSPTATPISNPKPSPSVVPYDFEMYGLYDINATRGASFGFIITLSTVSGDAKSVNPHDVIWSADCSTRDIQWFFNSTSYHYYGFDYQIFGESAPAHGFTNTFTITIPSSIPANNYAITVTAKIGSVSHSTSMLVLIKPPSAPQITVSGTIDVGNSGITGSQLQFQNLAAPAEVYYTTLTENGTYSIDLPNYSFYSVCIIDNGTAPNGTVRWLTVDHPFTVRVPDGGTSMTKDFTVPKSVP